jgi:hypothetical protein
MIYSGSPAVRTYILPPRFVYNHPTAIPKRVIKAMDTDSGGTVETKRGGLAEMAGQQVLDTLARVEKILEEVLLVDLAKERVRISGHFLRGLLTTTDQDNARYDEIERDFFGSEYEPRCEFECSCTDRYKEQLRRVKDRQWYGIDNFDAYVCALSRPRLPHKRDEPTYVYDERDEEIRLSVEDFNGHVLQQVGQNYVDGKQRRVRRVIRMSLTLMRELDEKNLPGVNRNGSVLMYGIDSFVVDCAKFNFASDPCDDIYHIVLHCDAHASWINSDISDYVSLDLRGLLSVLISKEESSTCFSFLFLSNALHRLKPLISSVDRIALKSDSQLFKEIVETRACCPRHAGTLPGSTDSANCHAMQSFDAKPSEYYVGVYNLVGTRKNREQLSLIAKRLDIMRDRLHDVISGTNFTAKVFVGAALPYDNGNLPVIFMRDLPLFKLFSPQCRRVFDKIADDSVHCHRIDERCCW